MPVKRGTGYNLTGETPPTSTWGANIFPGDGGAWHMYAAEFENNCDISSWSPNSAIVHATSTTGPDGPYTRTDVAIRPFAHNPKVVRAPDGTWLMYTIGTPVAVSDLKNCSMAVASLRGNDSNAAIRPDVAVRSHDDSRASPSAPPPPPGRTPKNLESNVTLFTSKSIEGPWARCVRWACLTRWPLVVTACVDHAIQCGHSKRLLVLSMIFSVATGNIVACPRFLCCCPFHLYTAAQGEVFCLA